MAENTRRMNNEPVFGSLAYDLNTLNWGEFDGNAVRQPQEQPQEPLRRPERRERPRLGSAALRSEQGGAPLRGNVS